MKKYLVFIISFAALFVLFQVSSGLLLTTFYTPDPTIVNGTLSNEVVFGDTGSSFLFTISILLTGTVAYFISQQFGKTAKAQTNA